MITPLNLQVDPTDQADLEALADQRRINQLEHQADLKDLAVLEDLEAQAVQAAPADQSVSLKQFSSWLRECTNERTALRCTRWPRRTRRSRRTRRPR